MAYTETVKCGPPAVDARDRAAISFRDEDQGSNTCSGQTARIFADTIRVHSDERVTERGAYLQFQLQ